MEELTAVFWSHTSRLYVPARHCWSLRLIAALPAWKLTSEANHIHFERKHHNGK
jgi:hypothetical protein